MAPSDQLLYHKGEPLDVIQSRKGSHLHRKLTSTSLEEPLILLSKLARRGDNAEWVAVAPKLDDSKSDSICVASLAQL